MKTSQKQFYECPYATVYEVRQEGVICASGQVQGRNSINNWQDGGTTTKEDFYM